MGKGDKKSRRGKIIAKSFGVRRPGRKKKPSRPMPVPKIKEKVVVEELPEVPVIAEPVAEAAPPEKKAPRKTVKKTAEEKDPKEPKEAKPKVPRAKKKTEEKSETLFDQPEEPAKE